MRKRRFIYLLISASWLLTLTGCCKYQDITTNSLVLTYHSMTELDADWDNNGYINLSAKTDSEYGVLSKNADDKKKYKAKCEKHNDFGYKRVFSYGPDGLMSDDYQDRDFIRIEIISNADYDETHPARSSLNDIFYFSARSPIKFIKSGYKDSFPWWDYDAIEALPEYYANYIDFYVYSGTKNYRGYPIYGLVSEMTPENLILLGGEVDYFVIGLHFATLTPVSPPALAKTHTFTITLTDDENRKFSTTLKVTFAE